MRAKIYLIFFFIVVVQSLNAQSVQLLVRVFLEGPFESGKMADELMKQNLLPQEQPYSGAPWNYNGAETWTVLPVSNVVDWVLVDLLAPAGDTTANSFSLLGRKAGLLLTNGYVINPQGGMFISFSVVPDPEMHLRIHHRNHLPVTSANPLLQTSANLYEYDFSTGAGQAIGGNSSQNLLTLGLWGMKAADGDANRQVDNKDKNDIWLNDSGNSGYLQGDYDLNGLVDENDILDKWSYNAGYGNVRMLGLLEVCPDNPRYFCDGGNPVFLTGSHIWDNLQDIGSTAFNYSEYLDWMVNLGHNFIRMWAWETPQGTDWAKDPDLSISPVPYKKVGPQFDVSQLNPQYFNRLHQRIQAADDKGIYVSIMLFQGFSAEHDPEAWQFHPFKAGNNINGIAVGQNEVHTNIYPAIVEAQRLYVREVIDMVNENNLTNVLYEIGNEIPHSTASDQWHYDMIDYIHQYEWDTYGVKRPVGMVFQYSNGANETLFNSPADWISPGPDDGFSCLNPDDAPISDGGKVIISDTDHFYYLQYSNFGHPHDLVWRSFTGGIQVIHMDNWGGGSNEPGRLHGGTGASTYDIIRQNMGYARQLAVDLDLLSMTPHPELSSTGFCLASNKELVVYLPETITSATVDLTNHSGQFNARWLDTIEGTWQQQNNISGGSTVPFSSPFGGYSVLVLQKIN